MIKPIINKLILNYSANKSEPENVVGKLEEFASAKRILLLRQDRIGDVLVTLPLLKKLRKVLNLAKIDILLSHKNKSTDFALKGLVDNVIVMKSGISGYKDAVARLKNSEYDVVVDLLDNSSTTSTMLVGATNATIKLGFEKENRNIYTHTVDLPDKAKYSISQRLNNLLIPFTGNSENNENHEIQLSEQDKYEAESAVNWAENKLRVGINLSGSNDSKNWGTGNYIAFLKTAKSKYESVDFRCFTTMSNKLQLSEIITATGGKAAPFVSSFREFTAMIATCDIIITPDTSVVHLCSAFNIPCIGLYLVSDNPNVGMPWKPESMHSKVLTAPHSESLEYIKITDVLGALDEIIEEIND